MASPKVRVPGWRRAVVVWLVPLLAAAHTWPVLVDLLASGDAHHCACPLDDHDCTCPVCSGDLKRNDHDAPSVFAEPCGLLPAKPGLLARVPAVEPSPERPLPAPVAATRASPPPFVPCPPQDPSDEPPTPPPRA